MGNDELLKLAEDVMGIVQNVMASHVLPYSEEVQRWAVDAVLRIDTVRHINQPLADAIEACLVDILSCDNASWDTTPAAFADDLNRLNGLVGMANDTA